MGMVVRTNTMSTNAYRQLGMNNNAVSKSLEKLSSGFRINRAGDDASGLAISEKMKAQINGLEQASANSQDGISLIQTAEGATTEIHNMLNRMVTLATKSANGTIQNEVDREAIQTEVNALSTEITRIAKATNFNGINLLDGTMGTGTTGAKANVAAAALAGIGAHTFTLTGVEDGFKLDIVSAATTGTDSVTAAFSNGKLTLTFDMAKDAEITQSQIDKAIQDAAGKPASAKNIKVAVEGGKVTAAANSTAGAAQTLTAATAKNATVTNSTNGVTVTSTKAGVNTSTLTFAAVDAAHREGAATVDGTNGNTTVYLDTSKKYTASEINAMLSKEKAGMTVSFDGEKGFAAAAATATTLGNTAYTLAGGAGVAAGGGLKLQVGDTNEEFNHVEVNVDDLTATGLGVSSLDVSTQDTAGNSISTIKEAINKVSTNRGNLGALQNRLEYTINNLDTTNENMSAANSRIRDTDMAKEMMNYTKMNILTQAAQAMLAQANQAPQQILQLLQ